MPELPEVETIVRGLRKALPGRTIRAASLAAPDLYRRGSRRISWIRDGRVEAVERMGKAILIRTRRPDSGQERALVVHLGMTGRLVLPAAGELGQHGKAAGPERRHRHARFVFDDDSELWFYDPRRFGYFHAGPVEGLREVLGIGPDPFEITAGEFADRLEGRRAAIKSALLNQKLVAGLGNIYADEVLFQSRVHPLAPAGRLMPRAGDLLNAARDVLRRAIRSRGTTLRDYRTADGSMGEFRMRLRVYGREGESCRRCGATIKRIVITQRSSHFCPRCQRRGRPRRRRTA